VLNRYTTELNACPFPLDIAVMIDDKVTELLTAMKNYYEDV